MPQVLHDEARGQLLVRAGAQAIHDLEELADKVDARGGEDHVPQPGREGVASQQRHEDQPEPQEDVDLLVEQVDGQHALHAVAVVVGHLAYFEVAHGDAWEAARGRPLRARGQVLQHLEAVQVVVRRQEGVQHEQLPNGVADVQHLHQEVDGQQKIAVAPAAQNRQLCRQDMAKRHTAPVPRLALVVQATVDVAHHVLDGAHAHLGTLVLGVAGQGHDAVDVDAGLPVEQAPDDARDVEHERLQ